MQYTFFFCRYLNKKFQHEVFTLYKIVSYELLISTCKSNVLTVKVCVTVSVRGLDTVSTPVDGFK